MSLLHSWQVNRDRRVDPYAPRAETQLMPMSSDSEADALLHRLLEGGGAAAAAWIEAVKRHQVQAPVAFKWLTLAEGASAHAQHAGDRLESMEWAKVALVAYEPSHYVNSSPNWIFSLVLSEMNLRAWMIGHYGAVPGDLVLDVQHITALFSRWVPLSYTETLHLLTSRRDPLDLSEFTRDDLRKLREVKNLLNRLHELTRHGCLPRDGFEHWLALYDRLP